MMKLTFLLSTLCLCFTVDAQNLNKNWESELNSSLSEFTKCSQGAETAALCYHFSGESVKKVYGVNDFYDAAQERYMLIDEIYEYLEGSNSEWTLLGKGYDQAALKKAQEQANQGKAVVAIKKEKNEDYGHMAIILPGEMNPSGSWGLRVPNAASFFTHQAEKSFVGKKLSYAFTSSDRGYVMIYVKK